LLAHSSARLPACGHDGDTVWRGYGHDRGDCGRCRGLWVGTSRDSARVVGSALAMAPFRWLDGTPGGNDRQRHQVRHTAPASESLSGRYPCAERPIPGRCVVAHCPPLAPALLMRCLIRPLAIELPTLS
jgi:hypothetical protein